MLHEEFDEIYSRECSLNIDVIFMAVVMESNGIGRCIIAVDPFCGDDRAAEIPADIFRNGPGIR